MRRGLLALALAFALAAASLALTGCQPDTETETDSDVHPAVALTTGALEVRMSRSTDPADYEPYFTPEIAGQLAASAELENEAEATHTPIPTWQPPFVAWETSEGVAVVVVWDREPPFEEWPPATRLDVEPTDGGWIITDAFEMTEEELVGTLAALPEQ